MCLFVVIFISLFTPGASPAQAVHPENWQHAVREKLDERQFKLAAGLVDEILDAEPLNLEARQFRAEWFARRGRVDEALWQLADLLVSFPGDRRNVVLEAQWLSQLGRSGSALEIYNEWLAIHADDVDMRIRRTLALRSQGDLNAALADLESAIAAGPENAGAHHSHVRTLDAAGQASEAWRVADEYDRDTGSTDAEIGLIKAAMLSRIGAIDLAEELANRPPADPDQRLRQGSFRAMLRIRAGRQQEGLELLAPYSNLLSADYDALMAVGNAYAAADRLNVARACFERAIAVTPARPDARMGLARLASREGRLKDSLARYQQIALDNPQALEASLGVIRTASLQRDFKTAREALNNARTFAPHSVELYREGLRLALEGGSTREFDNVLKRYESDHPRDPMARLWRARWTALRTMTINFNDVVGLLDPFAPDVTATALALLNNTAQGRNLALFNEWSTDAALPARAELFQTLATQMAIRLNPDWTARFAKLAEASRSQVTDSKPESSVLQSRDRDKIPGMLASGWFAFVATPFAWSQELTRDFDEQAINIWLVNEVQNRFRTMSIETESPLYEDWLLRRALWFDAWKDNWNTAEAANSIFEYLAQMVPGGYERITLQQVESAWRLSEVWLPAASTDFNLRVTQARWRQGRHDFTGALKLYREIAAEFRDAAEPAQREASLLRGLGRADELLACLRALNARPFSNPAARMESATLLTQLGEFQNARRQLALAEQSGFKEPALFLKQAELAEARGLPFEAGEWINRGREIYPDAASLLSWQATQLLEQQNTAGLAALIQTHGSSTWLTPDLLAAAEPNLPADEVEAITRSPEWWFSWQWLPWERLESRSLTALRRTSRAAIANGERDLALEALLPAISARLPDTDLWLAAGRLFDLNHRPDDGRRAYELAHQLGLGRPDAAVASLARLAQRADPEYVARELANRLRETPDDVGLRGALITALLQMGEVTAAERALAPLVETSPNDSSVKDLAAQIKAAKGQVKQARSLYSSILHGDPTNTDPGDALRLLQSGNQWGFASGYEYSVLNNTVGGPDPANWQEAFVGVFYTQPIKHGLGLEYRWFERSNETASQIRLDYTTVTGPDWIWRANVAPAAVGDIIPRLRLGGGTSYRVVDPFFVGMDFAWLTFSDLDVYQFAPGFTWRWHPRSTIDSKLYVSSNVLDTGAANSTLTWVANANWELSKQSSARLSFATGGESVTNPIRRLINNDDITSVGLSMRIGLRHRWTLEPAWRFEMHKNFNLNAFGLSLVYSY